MPAKRGLKIADSAECLEDGVIDSWTTGKGLDGSRQAITLVYQFSQNCISISHEKIIKP
jgi:hypothetical protein